MKIASAVQTVNGVGIDENGNVDVNALPAGGTTGQVLTKVSNTSGDADWADPSGHTIQNASGVDMTGRDTLQFLNAEVTDDAVNGKTVVDCQGEKGDPGDAATVTVGTVTTLPAGSNATVVNVGSTSAAIFDFGIPKGQDGTGATNAYKYVKVGATTITASGEDTLELIAGSHIELTPDAVNKSVTITATVPDVPAVINTLTSESTTDALSAYQGNLLNAAVLLKADATALDGWVGPSYANASYQVVFDDLDDNYGYEINAKDAKCTWKDYTIGTGTNSGKKLTYTVNSTNVTTGNGGTAFYLRILK